MRVSCSCGATGSRTTTCAASSSRRRSISPRRAAPELASPKVGPYLNRYAGRQLTDGAQAKAYADHFIAVHLQTIGGGLTYSELSAKAMAQPANAALAGQVNTVFRGETLRGMLLNA